jgi:precorrin-6A synthase
MRRLRRKLVKKILVIGIGAGDPDYITIQAINALNQVDVFFVMDKGVEKGKLSALRREICERFIKHRNYRIVEPRAPIRATDAMDYRSAVEDLNREKGVLFERLIQEEMKEGECGAFLVWGDPSLYDSTIRILRTLAAIGHGIEFEVIPGISSVQALAAKHKITLNQIGNAFEVMTGRRLEEGFPNNMDSLVVMLDANATFKQFADQDIDIFWGAYVGTPDEILVAGKLRDVVGDIERLRAEARAANGWIMDSYIMHRARGTGERE